MTYQQALAFVEETKKYGSILGLDSIRALMKELGDVQEDLSTIHIAGTNGKGSVGAMLQAVLEEAGLKVGRYSSPAVFSYREIWQINGKAVSEEAYAALMEKVKTACLTLTEKGLPHPTSVPQRFYILKKKPVMWCYWKPAWVEERMQPI